MKLGTSIWALLIIFAAVLPRSAFAQSGRSAGDTAAASSCVCDCVYLQNSNIKNHRYYNAGAGGSCNAIEGKACIGELRGENFRGRVQNCLAGPSQISGPLSSWVHLRHVARMTQNQSPADLRLLLKEFSTP